MTRYALGVLAAIVLQAGIVGFILFDRAQALATGEEVRLETGFVDPRDIFRGHYVTLNLRISRLNRGDVDFPADLDRGEVVYVALSQPEEGFAQAVSVHRSPPDGMPSIRGTVRFGSNENRLTLEFPFDRYFAPKDRALELEGLRQDMKLGVILALSPDGTGMIKGIVADGDVIYEEPIF
ncbi:MAG: GDYXXLXY domain-containing protein [Pseudomonadota bacterium]